MEEYTPWIVSTFGYVLAGYAIYLYIKDRRLDQWPKVEGKVLYSDVIDEVDLDGGKIMTMYSPYVKYEYEVNGVSYKAENIGLVESSCSIRSFAESKIMKYPSGKAVSVYYNPGSVEESYLEKNVGMWTYLFLIIGAVACLYGGYKF